MPTLTLRDPQLRLSDTGKCQQTEMTFKISFSCLRRASRPMGGAPQTTRLRVCFSIKVIKTRKQSWESGTLVYQHPVY